MNTDVPAESLATDEVVANYKALGNVERAFRSMKQVHLEMRPVSENRTSTVNQKPNAPRMGGFEPSDIAHQGFEKRSVLRSAWLIWSNYQSVESNPSFSTVAHGPNALTDFQ